MKGISIALFELKRNRIYKLRNGYARIGWDTDKIRLAMDMIGTDREKMSLEMKRSGDAPIGQAMETQCNDQRWKRIAKSRLGKESIGCDMARKRPVPSGKSRVMSRTDSDKQSSDKEKRR